MLKALHSLFKAASRYIRGWFTGPYRTEIVAETLPTKLKRRTIYIVMDDGFEEFAAMNCPCGCNEVLYMNLLPDERPCWKVSCHANGTATLHPSVWRKKGCQSHFWFRRGEITWC